MSLILWSKMEKEYDELAKVKGVFERKRIELYTERDKIEAPPFIEGPSDDPKIPYKMVTYRLPALIFLEQEENVAINKKFGPVLRAVGVVELAAIQVNKIEEFMKDD